MELAFGKVLPLKKALQLGVLEGAEALTRENDNSPWEAQRPVDVPVEQQTDTEQVDMADQPKHNVSLHRALSHLHKGGLHRALGIPEGQPIPQDKLDSAKNSDNPHIRHMAAFASVLEGFHHKS